MFKYKINFWLADEGLRIRENLEEYSRYLEMAKKHYNMTSSKAKNRKEIEDLKYINDGKELEIVLLSEQALTRPSLGLQTFSAYLVKETPMKSLVRGKALFRGSWIELAMENNESAPSKIEDISDADLMKYLLDIILSSKKSSKQIKLIKQIKQIIIEN